MNNKYKMIERKADELIKKNNLTGIFPVPVGKISELLGYKAFYFKNNPEIEEISGAVDHLKKEIYINDAEDPFRQTFTLAHEIGHIILHGDQKNYIDYRTPSSKPKELEANHFAACLLMPENIFKTKWFDFKNDILQLSDYFGVTEKAIIVRAKNLGLIA